MRRAVSAAITALLVWTPSIAFANLCPGQAPGTNVRTESIYSKDGAKSTTQRMIGGTDTCSDEAVSITRELLSATVRSWTTRRCTQQDLKTYGCKPGQTQPKVCIQLSGGQGTTAITVSKCDKAGMLRAFNESIDGETVQPLLALASAQQQQQAQPGPTAAPAPTVGNAQLSQALQTIGVPQSEAEKLASAEPDKVSQLVQKIQAGDNAGAQDIAKALKLNPDVITKIAALRPEDLPQPTQTPPLTPDPAPPRGQNTGFDPQQTPQAPPQQQYYPPQQARSPFAGITSPPPLPQMQPQQMPSSLGTSPFSQMSPVSLNQNAQQTQVNSLADSVMRALQGGGTQTTPQATSTQPRPVAPAALILVQPQSITTGSNATVSWSSVGMRSETPCTVSIQGGQTIGKGNGGSTVYRAASEDAGKGLLFVLTCTAQNGERVERSTSLQVR